MDIDLTFTLELMAGVAYAKSLWEEPSIKVKVFEACDSRSYNRSSNSNRETGLNSISKELVNNVYEKNLPDIISVNLVHIVKSMGKKIFHWAEYLQRNFRLKVRNPDAIYWTSVGTIDQKKIFQKSVSNMLIKNFYEVCDMASRCAQLEFIESHSAEIKEHLVKHKSSSNADHLKTHKLIVRTLIHVNKSFQEDLNLTDDIVDSDEESELTKLFDLAVTTGSDIAVKYYWNKMNVIDQEGNILNCWEKCFKLYKASPYEQNYMQEKYVEILIFLMSKMSEDQIKKILVLDKKCKILIMFLTVWPAQHFFISVFSHVKDSLTGSQYIKILSETLNHLVSFADSELNAHENFYYKFFKVVWHSFTSSLKDAFCAFIIKPLKEIEKPGPNVFESDNGRIKPSFKMIMIQLFRIFHLEGLKLIINDQHLVNERDLLINVGVFKFKELVRQENYEMLNRFMLGVFDSYEGEENFKLKFNFYEDLIIDDKLDAVQKLLIWQSNSEDERLKLLKSGVSFEEMCEKLIKYGKCNVAEKFLRWVLKNEEVEDLKNKFKSENFVKETIYYFWKNRYELNSKEKILKNSDDFLNWILNSKDDVDLFKQEKLFASYECVSLYFKNLNEEYKILSEKKKWFQQFLLYCNLTEEKISEVKKNVIENIHNLLVPSDRKSKIWFSDIEYLISWVAEKDPEKKKEIIKKLLDSVDIFLLSNMIFESNRERLRFYNQWILENPSIITKLKNERLSRISTTELDDYYASMKSVFEKLETGCKLNIQDVRCIEDYEDYDFDNDSFSDFHDADYDNTWDTFDTDTESDSGSDNSSDY